MVSFSFWTNSKRLSAREVWKTNISVGTMIREGCAKLLTHLCGKYLDRRANKRHGQQWFYHMHLPLFLVAPTPNPEHLTKSRKGHCLTIPRFKWFAANGGVPWEVTWSITFCEIMRPNQSSYCPITISCYSDAE